MQSDTQGISTLSMGDEVFGDEDENSNDNNIESDENNDPDTLDTELDIDNDDEEEEADDLVKDLYNDDERIAAWWSVVEQLKASEDTSSTTTTQQQQQLTEAQQQQQQDLWNKVIRVCQRDPQKVVYVFLSRIPPTPEIAQALLDAWALGGGPSGTSASSSLAQVRDMQGRTVLHYACSQGAHVDIVQALVDREPSLLSKTNAMNQKLPIFYACQHASECGLTENDRATIRFLVQRGASLYSNDTIGSSTTSESASAAAMDPLLATIVYDEISDDVIAFLLETGDWQTLGRRRDPKSNLLPVQIAIVKKRSADEVIAPLLAGDRLHFKGYTTNMIELLADTAAKSPQLQHVLNTATVRRWPTALLFFDFWCHLDSIALFVFAADSYLLDYDQSTWATNLLHVLLYLLAAYFLLREYTQLMFHGYVDYITNVWNLLDLARIGSLLASTICMSLYPGGDEVTRPVRYLLLVTGGFVVQGLVLFVRATFLPFALFVGGLVVILRTLVPFLIVSVCIVFSFAFMYYTAGFDEDDCDENGFCSLDQAILTTFNYFFSGPQQTNVWWLDLTFGLVISIILLNVVIAIVSQAWEDGYASFAPVFWDYRISFLAEVESLSSNVIFRTLLGPVVYFFSTSKLNSDIDRIARKLEHYEEEGNSEDETRDEPGGGGSSSRRRPGRKFDDSAKKKFATKIRDFHERLKYMEENGYEEYTETHQKLKSLEKLFSRKARGAPYTRFKPNRKKRIPLLARIDNLGRLPVSDSINWYARPYESHVYDATSYYSLAYGKEEKSVYCEQNPSLSDGDFEKLSNIGSFERNWYWSTRYYWRRGDEVSKRNKKSDELVKRPRRVALEFTIYVVLLVLGMCSFGILWPVRVRRQLLAGSTSDKKSQVLHELKENEGDLDIHMTKKAEAIDRRKKRMAAKSAKRGKDETRLDKLEEKVEEISLKLDKLDSLALKLNAVLDMLNADSD